MLRNRNDKSELSVIIRKVQERLDRGELPINIHIDEVYAISEDPDTILGESINLFNLFTTSIAINQEINIRIDIELKSESMTFNGCPNTLKELKESIDVYSIPELIIDKRRYKEIGSSEIEYYLCPLPFSIGKLTDNSKIMYSEYRRHKNEEYYRWLTITL